MAARTPRAPQDAGVIEDIEVLDENSEPVRLGSLWEEGPAVIVWLRHYG
jgi:hypothetical protein